MPEPRRSPWSRERRWTAVFVGPLAVIVALIGLWLAHPNGAGSSSSSAAACRAVAAALADGPDPAADPVGYAEAQIRPLSQISTSNVALHDAIENLRSAYHTYFDDGGGAAAQRALTRASASLEHYCPGTTS